MIDNQAAILGPIKAIIADELPENITARVDLVFGNLCDGQEDNFKLLIAFLGMKRAVVKKGRGSTGATESTNEFIKNIVRIF